MAKKQLYWKGEEELFRTKEFLASQKNEFNEALPLDEVFSENNMGLSANRRDFLKFFGFSVAAVSLAACNSTPVRNVVPYLVKPEEITPGNANYYNSTCGVCPTGCGVTVKTREGRPIKVDGNINSPISGGGLCTTGQASILGLYDTERLDGPVKVNGGSIAKTDWTTMDGEITSQLSAIQIAGGKIAIVSGTINSPSSLAVINDFKTKYTNTNHITYDAMSYSGMLIANRDAFGKQVIPSYDFRKANVVVSFAADFLGTWLSPVEFTRAWSERRKVEGIAKDGKVLKTIIFESNLSLTGTNADYRFPMKSSQEAVYITSLHNAIARLAGQGEISIAQSGELAGDAIKQTAAKLWNEKGNSIVISGSNDPKIQLVVNGINMMLGNYGTTIDLDNHSNQYKGIDSDMVGFASDLKNGAYSAVIFWNANPVYSSPLSADILAGLKKAKLSISFAGTKDETASACQYIAPDNHYLESWNDSEPKAGLYQLTQPTISPVFMTRQAQESLLTWAGMAVKPATDPFANKGIYNQKLSASIYYLYIKSKWAAMGVSSDEAFNKALHDGVYQMPAKPLTVPAMAVTLNSIVSDLQSTIGNKAEMDLVLYQNISVKDGSMSNNPWIQETPDPMSKVTWDNYVSLPKAFAEKEGIKNGDLVNVTYGKVTLNGMPVFVQPGQSNGTVGLAVGYGRKGKVGEKGEFEAIGKNAYPFMKFQNGTYNNVINGVKVTKIDGSYELAQTQTHNSIEGRDIVRETTLNEIKDNPKAGNDKVTPHLYTLWETKAYKKEGAPNHHWAMAIDLNACTGCSACVVSCSIENNVPVVGRAEVRRRREMHWMRIDRYFTFENRKMIDYSNDLFLSRDYEGKDVTKETGLAALDEIEAKNKGEFSHWENVKVVHQPMMCQHCGQAPCETVCPVLATTHSSEGLNQMTYNRCIGTKYCANNCPYKVRRFNWFRYNDNDRFDFYFNNDLGKMVINPDVTVRTRGVMEKCSMCVQNIQAGKTKAKREKRQLTDGEVKTACQRACPAGAIVFGDVNDPNSEVHKLFKNERSYRVLEELNTQTAVKYMVKVRDTEKVKA